MDTPKVAVIAGATGPTGQATARRFPTEKSVLALISRDREKLFLCSESANTINATRILLYSSP